eukprot:scaffold37589_cov27-Tisochrysis_lutea.AAC.2
MGSGCGYWGRFGPSSAMRSFVGECCRISRSGACVTMPVPVGIRSKPVRALMSVDLPEDCVPMTT